MSSLLNKRDIITSVKKGELNLFVTVKIRIWRLLIQL